MTRDGARASRLREDEKAAFSAWGLFLRTHATLSSGLDGTLRCQAGITLSAYDVLAQLAGSPDRTLGMHALEQRVLFSQSTVSRLTARLERDGLLTRSVDPSDRRALEVRLTADGVALFSAARAVAIVYLRERFTGRLGPGQDRALLEILTSIGDGTKTRLETETETESESQSERD